MKRFLFIFGTLLMFGLFCACSNSDDLSDALGTGKDKSGTLLQDVDSLNTSNQDLYKEILGEWIQVKSVGTFGCDRLKFISDSSYYYKIGENYNEGKFKIIELDYEYEVGTVDYQTRPSHFFILFSPYKDKENTYATYYFIAIDGDKMHLQAQFAYTYSAVLFERVK
jgi:hypothetical protein